MRQKVAPLPPDGAVETARPQPLGALPLPHQALPNVVTHGVVNLLLVAVTGCAPLVSLRPASGLMPGRELEVGAGVGFVTPRPFVDEPVRGAGQAWTSGDASSRLSLSAIGAFDTDAIALGGALRWNALETDRIATGLEVELGYAWAAISVPMALRAFDETWAYTGPRLGTWGSDLLVGLPIGASVRVVDGFMLRGEAQASFQGAEHHGRRFHLGAGAAYQR